MRGPQRQGTALVAVVTAAVALCWRMSIDFHVEHRLHYAVVRVDGEPTLDEFLESMARFGTESTAWPQGRLMCDLRSIRTLQSFTEQYAVGEAVVRHLPHMRKIASLVPGDRVTRASQKTAQRAGANLMVFSDEAEAIQWLNSDQP